MDQSGLTIPAPPVATLPTLRKRATSVTPALMQQVFALRAEHPGWTQREIAMTAGLSRTVISAIIAGRYEVVQEGRHQVARPLMAGAPPAQQAAPAPELAPPAWLGSGRLFRSRCWRWPCRSSPTARGPPARCA